MADKNSYEENLAEAIHKAERNLREALGRPAGHDRIQRILDAQEAHDELWHEHDHCLTGQAGAPIKRKR
jgi:hypothetical protein